LGEGPGHPAGAFYHPPVAFGSRPWLLPASVLLGVLMAAGLATLAGGLHRRPAPVAPKPAHAIVVESAPCARPGARDTVLFVVEGRSYRLPMDACGNPEGFHLDVELSFGADGTPAVHLAGTGPAPPGADHTGTLLLALSSLACALLTVHTSPGLRHARAVRRRLSSAGARAATRTRAHTQKLVTAVVSPGRQNARDHDEGELPAEAVS
jgi:hypothetical protein